VNLAVVSALAAAFSGCGDKKETAYCVDRQDRVVENHYCDDEFRPGSYFFYYGGHASGGFRRGSTVNGGQPIDAANKAANAQRGGFGGTAKSGGVGVSFAKSGGS